MESMALNKKLNVESVNAKLTNLGLSQSNIADELGVSRQTVSQWIKEIKFPRPAKLLKLSNLLKLPFDQLVIKTDLSTDPVVAFRKKGSHIISDECIEGARDKGFLLQQLVDYLPFDNLSKPPSLIDPKLDYEYIHRAADQVRNAIGKSGREEIRFEDLIEFFSEYHAVVIPVFWGNILNHANALHIYLPSSMTTWIYLNLDSKVHDFKFWMAHELGHVKSPDLQPDLAEDFADLFAGALLVGHEVAEQEYNNIARLKNKGQQINRIKEIAEELIVSPLTVYFEINRFADYAGKEKIDLEPERAIYKATTEFNKKYQPVAAHIFESLPPSAKKYISVASEVFMSPFFDTLRKYLSENKKSVGFLQELLNLSPADTHTLFEEIG